MADDVTPNVNSTDQTIADTPTPDVVPTPDVTSKANDVNMIQDENIQKFVSEKVEEALKPIKGNLDSAYAARDEALKKVAEFEQKEREAEVKRLQEEGKHKEAFEKQLATEKARSEALEKRNVELTRDVELRSALNSHDFRNKNAAEMAYKEIAADLVRNERDEWVHKTGVSISEYVSAFVSNEDNAFLMKQKVSNGTGSTATTTNPGVGVEGKSLFSLPQSEVLKMAAEGKLPPSG